MLRPRLESRGAELCFSPTRFRQFFVPEHSTLTINCERTTPFLSCVRVLALSRVRFVDPLIECSLQQETKCGAHLWGLASGARSVRASRRVREWRGAETNSKLDGKRHVAVSVCSFHTLASAGFFMFVVFMCQSRARQHSCFSNLLPPFGACELCAVQIIHT